MKKALISNIGSFLGGFAVGASVAKKNTLELAETNRNISDKHLALFLLMNQWVKVKQAGICLADYFEKKGYKRIAVYGMSYVGERLIDELKDSSIHIKYGIDKKEKGNINGLKIVDPSEIIETVDVIVVTPIFFMDEIEEDLRQRISCPIISLEEILYYVMEE